MSIILGFGDYHVRKGKDKADAVAAALVNFLKEAPLETISTETLRAFEKKLCADSEKHISSSGSEYDTLWVCFPCVEGTYWKNIIVEFHISHYRNDHPMSPDGFACMDQRFTFSAVVQDKLAGGQDDWKVRWSLAEGGLTEEV